MLKNKFKLPFDWVALPILLCGIFAIQLVRINLTAGIPAGDFFNYLGIARNFTGYFMCRFEESRLPFYPLVILIGLPLFEAIKWATAVNVLSGLGTLGLTFLVGRKLGIERFALYLAIIFLGCHWLFLENTTRPCISEPIYALLIMLAICVFYQKPVWQNQLLLGLLLGFACMTRYDGFIISFVLLAARGYLNGWKQKGLTLFSIVPVLILVTPLLVRNLIFYGSPIWSVYTHRLQIGGVPEIPLVPSTAKLLENAGYFLDVFYMDMWGAERFFYSGIIFIGFGAISLIMFNRRASVVALALVFHMLFVLWTRSSAAHYYIQLPIWGLLLANGIWRVSEITSRAVPLIPRRLAICILASALFAFMIPGVVQISWDRLQADKDDVYKRHTFVEAVDYLGQHTQGNVGFTISEHYDRYKLDSRVKTLDVEKLPLSEEEQLKWLKDNNISYLVTTTLPPYNWITRHMMYPRFRNTWPYPDDVSSDEVVFTVLQNPKYKDRFELAKKFTRTYCKGEDAERTMETRIYRYREAGEN